MGGVKNDSNIVHSLFCHGYPLIPFFSSSLDSDCSASGSIPHYIRHPGFPFQGLKRGSVHERECDEEKKNVNRKKKERWRIVITVEIKFSYSRYD